MRSIAKIFALSLHFPLFILPVNFNARRIYLYIRLFVAIHTDTISRIEWFVFRWSNRRQTIFLTVDFGISGFKQKSSTKHVAVEIPTQKSRVEFLNGIDKLHSYFLCAIISMKFSSINTISIDLRFVFQFAAAPQNPKQRRKYWNIHKKASECVGTTKIWKGANKISTNVYGNGNAHVIQLKWIYASN